MDEWLGEEGTSAQQRRRQQLKDSGDLSEPQNHLFAMGVSTVCVYLLADEIGCMLWVFKLYFIPLPGLPSMVMAASRGRRKKSQITPTLMLFACRGLASPPSAGWWSSLVLSSGVPSNAVTVRVPPQLQSSGTPALLGANWLLCSCQQQRCWAWAFCWGTGMQMMAFVSVYWSASCNQLSPQCTSLLLTIPLDWAPLLKIGWEWRGWGGREKLY